MTVIAGFDDLAAMRESIEQRRGHLGIAEHAAPFAERQVGRDDQRDALVEFAGQMEQQRAAILRERQVTQFIEHDYVPAQQARGESAGSARALLSIELIDQIHDAVEAHPLALHHDLTRKRSGQMRLAGSGAADQHDVARGAEVFAGVELADLALIHG